MQNLIVSSLIHRVNLSVLAVINNEPLTEIRYTPEGLAKGSIELTKYCIMLEQNSPIFARQPGLNSEYLSS